MGGTLVGGAGVGGTGVNVGRVNVGGRVGGNVGTGVFVGTDVLVGTDVGVLAGLGVPVGCGVIVLVAEGVTVGVPSSTHRPRSSFSSVSGTPGWQCHAQRFIEAVACPANDPATSNPLRTAITTSLICPPQS